MLFTKKQNKPHVSSKVKAFGRARLEIAQRVQNREAWENLWKPPMQEFPFEWGPHWKQCVEYKVDDFSTEVGFLIDVLGLPVNAFNPDYAMFTSPDRDFFFAVVQAPDGMKSTPSDALRIQFMVADIFSLTENLRGRGVQFEGEPGPVAEGSEQWVASFRTPHGIHMEIWGLVEMVPDVEEKPVPEKTAENNAASLSRHEAGQRLPAEKLFAESPMDKTLTDTGLPEKLDISEFPAVKQESDGRPNSPLKEYDAEETPPSKNRYSPKERIAEASNLSSREREQPLPQVAEPKPQYAEKEKAKEPNENAQTVQAAPSTGMTAPPNGKRKKVRLLPRSAVRAAVPSAITSDSLPKAEERVDEPVFKPAPKKIETEKPSSIWDDFAEDVEYLDVDGPAEEEDYHYKPIPLNRDE